MTLLPWILWQARRARGARGTAGLVGVCSRWTCSRATSSRSPSRSCAPRSGPCSRRTRARRAARCSAGSGGLALAALAAAPQILATALWIPETNRGVLGMQLSNAMLYSISAVAAARARRALSVRPGLAARRVGAVGRPRPHYRGMGLFGTLYCGALPVIAAGCSGVEAPSGAPLRAGAACSSRSPCPCCRPSAGVLGHVAVAAAAAQPREVLRGPRARPVDRRALAGFDVYAERRRPRGVARRAVALIVGGGGGGGALAGRRGKARDPSDRRIRAAARAARPSRCLRARHRRSPLGRHARSRSRSRGGAGGRKAAGSCC